MSLFYMKQFLKSYPKSMLFSYFTETPIKDSISGMQLKLQYNIDFAM